MHYSDQQLQGFLQDDEDLVSAAPRLRHLESCAKCQLRLAQLSGDTQLSAVLDTQSGSAEAACGQTGRSLKDGSLEGGSLEGRASSSLEFLRRAILNEQPVEGEDNFWQTDPDSGQFSSAARSITVSIGPSGDWEDEAERREKGAQIPPGFLKPALYPDLMGRLGRYDVEHVIGAGGFGIVLKAHDSELRRVVALKVLAPHLMSSVAARQRFAREAQTAAAIVHEHVIPIYDVVSNDDHCYLVMQYIAGESLQERVDRQGPLPIEDVLRIASQIAAGLNAAHQQGVVHRDVKPANILMEESVDRVLISDFGLARTADDANLTRSGVITGTPHYMSPEQASGSLVDDRSDLFSLGSVMYFMCTGRPPFRAPQIVAVLNRICNHAHRPVNQIQSQIPRPVSALIDRLLSKNPERRFRSAAEAHKAIGQLLADYQSGKLAAEVQRAEVQERWQNRLWQSAKLLGTVAASALIFWGGAQVWKASKADLQTPGSSKPESLAASGQTVNVNTVPSLAAGGSLPSGSMASVGGSVSSDFRMSMTGDPFTELPDVSGAVPGQKSEVTMSYSIHSSGAPSSGHPVGVFPSIATVNEWKSSSVDTWLKQWDREQISITIQLRMLEEEIEQEWKELSER